MLLQVLLLLTATTVLADDDPKPIKPAEASKHVGDLCTVEFRVTSTAKAAKGMVSLYSEDKAANPKNFTVSITASGIKNFKKAEIDDPATFYKGKTIQATGLIRMVKKQYQIVIDDPEMLKVVPAKK